MKKTVLFSTVLSLAALPAIAQQPVDLSAQGARVYNGTEHRLTAPTKAAQADVVRAFLGNRKSSAAFVASLVDQGRHRTESGLTHVRMGQEVAGLEVYGAYVKAAVDAQGRLAHLIDATVDVTPAGVAPAKVASADALQVALAHLYPKVRLAGAEKALDANRSSFAGGSFFYRDPMVTRVAVAMDDGSLQEGFLVETWTGRTNVLHHTLVSGDGEVLKVELRTNTDSYNIFDEHPGAGSQHVVAGPGLGNAQSPAGWLGAGTQRSISISGNNVHAYLDRDNNGGPDAGGTVVSDGNFVTNVNLSQEPTTSDNQNVAVQNLFYLNNIIHDKLYSHGFVEATRNFQNDNFGNGGVGGDAVNAEAQDGGGTNNANFSTPSDGSPGRMQMYLWTRTTPGRDGDLDGDIVWHEYGHGLTWRMIGSMGGSMSGAIGEGNADVLALLAYNEDRVGEYATNDPDGIRSAPYTNYGRTYGDFGGNSVHFDGEIYAATMWRLWELYQQNGISNDTLWDDMVGGMNFTPAGPAFEDMRDGILAQADASRDCLIWEAFAAFGIGEGASASIKGRRVNVTESFTVPAACAGSCVPTEPNEVSCFDNLDNDCDGDIDAADSDCGGTSCTPAGGSCSANNECCSGNCKGRTGAKSCK